MLNENFFVARYVISAGLDARVWRTSDVDETNEGVIAPRAHEAQAATQTRRRVIVPRSTVRSACPAYTDRTRPGTGRSLSFADSTASTSATSTARRRECGSCASARATS